MILAVWIRAAGITPLSLSAVVAGNILFAGAGLYVRRSRRR